MHLSYAMWRIKNCYIRLSGTYFFWQKRIAVIPI
nr:MAG TPA: capsid protein precursor [Caudoviricetes sp.]